MGFNQGDDRADGPREDRPLRRGWTTGACATAATKAALTALLTGAFPDPVAITLPKGETPSFALNRHSLEEGRATAAIIKDAGDDPDVTHLAEIVATVASVRPAAVSSSRRARASAPSPAPACRSRRANRRSTPSRGR